MKKICIVAGARPNFMKVAPIIRSIRQLGRGELEYFLVHTGQHYDPNMSDIFFEELGISTPDFYLDCKGTHFGQISKTMASLEEICIVQNPHIMVVVGDVNSTVAAALTAKSKGIPLAHIEAGLRSNDFTMPEEINRIITDSVTDLFFTSEEQANINLLNEGRPKERIYFVGQIMIDNLYYQIQQISQNGPPSQALDIRSHLPERYLCLTLHRASNVDDPNNLKKLFGLLREVSEEYPIIFPCHPRTRTQISKNRFGKYFSECPINGNIDAGILLTEPMSYNNFLYLWKDAMAVLTDSGGLQEETTALKVPCLTLRKNTERPITVEVGSNTLIGDDYPSIGLKLNEISNGTYKKSHIPELWDGKSSERIVQVLVRVGHD